MKLEKIAKPFKHDIHFDIEKLDSDYHCYVLFVDIMGMKTTMLRSFSQSTIFMGKLHCALNDLQYKFRAIKIYPVMDGAYIVSKEREAMVGFIKYLFKYLGEVFVSANKPENCFLVRGCLAFGPMIDGELIDKGVNRQLAENVEYKNKLLFGFPMILAYNGERKAPPFGIYLDTTVRVAANRELSGIWYKWCKDMVLKEKIQNGLKSYFQWAKSKSLELMYDEDKIENHEKLSTQYWG